MQESVKFAAIVLVYFLIVYLTAIRRGGQQLLPWVFLILVQSCSAYYFDTASAYVKGMPFCMYLPEPLCKAVTFSGLVLANLLLIFLINILLSKKNGKKDEAFLWTEDVESILPLDLDLTEKTASLNDEVQNFVVNEALMNAKAETGENLNLDDEAILNTIQKLSDEGNREAAMKYLRMVVYFGKNKNIVGQAKRMLTEVQEKEE